EGIDAVVYEEGPSERIISVGLLGEAAIKFRAFAFARPEEIVVGEDLHGRSGVQAQGPQVVTPPFAGSIALEVRASLFGRADQFAALPVKPDEGEKRGVEGLARLGENLVPSFGRKGGLFEGDVEASRVSAQIQNFRSPVNRCRSVIAKYLAL